MITFATIPFETMPLWTLALATLCGMAFLWVGGDRLTVAARSFGASLGLPRSVIDIVVTSVATSVPLLVTALAAVKQGSTDIAVTSITGSVVTCLCLFLGVSSCVWPGAVEKLVATRDMSILLAAAMLFSFFGYQGGLTLRWYEGLILIVAGVFFMGFQLFRAFGKAEGVREDAATEMPPARALGWVVGAMAAIVAGAYLLVTTSIIGAARVGVSEIVAGTTAVAFGASLPIFSRAIAAGRSGHAEAIASGIITASIFNLLFASGVASTAGTLFFMPMLFHVELPSLFGATILLWLLMRTRSRLDRMEGAVLIVTYAALMYAAVRGSM
jgi:cation:H+ antiporter